MRRTRVKICGLTRAEDVVAAVEAGADACGFIFADSPRRVTVEQAARLAAEVPRGIERVGVFVDAELPAIEKAVNECALTMVQLSGGESPEYCSAVSVEVIKTLGVGTGFGIETAKAYRGRASAVLLDTYDPQRAGGTSRTFAWSQMGALPGWASFFVAGGLTPANVGEAIRTLRPFGVDVSSGVEATPGIKDPLAIRAFCAAVRAADQEVYA